MNNTLKKKTFEAKIFVNKRNNQISLIPKKDFRKIVEGEAKEHFDFKKVKLLVLKVK